MNTATMLLIAVLQMLPALCAIWAVNHFSETATKNLWLTHKGIRFVLTLPIRAYIVLNVFAGIFPALGIASFLARSNAANAFQQSVIILALLLSTVAWFFIFGLPALYWGVTRTHRTMQEVKDDVLYEREKRRQARAAKRAQKEADYQMIRRIEDKETTPL